MEYGGVVREDGQGGKLAIWTGRALSLRLVPEAQQPRKIPSERRFTPELNGQAVIPGGRKSLLLRATRNDDDKPMETSSESPLDQQGISEVKDCTTRGIAFIEGGPQFVENTSRSPNKCCGDRVSCLSTGTQLVLAVGNLGMGVSIPAEPVD